MTNLQPQIVSDWPIRQPTLPIYFSAVTVDLAQRAYYNLVYSSSLYCLSVLETTHRTRRPCLGIRAIYIVGL